MPLWVGILQASSDWGLPPWEWAGGDKLDWYYRWVFYTSTVREKQKRDSQVNYER